MVFNTGSKNPNPPREDWRSVPEKKSGRKAEDRDTLNLEKGVAGWKAILDNNHWIKLMWHWQENNWKNRAGRELLEKWFHLGELPNWFKWEDREKPIVSLKTLYNWKIDLKDKYEEYVEKESNMPVDWSDRGKIACLSNVPIEGNLRGELFKWWQHLQRTMQENLQDEIRPSYRVLKWWAYMYDYYPELEINDKIWIAEQFFWRDALTAIEHPDTLEMDRDDIDQWLLHEPWDSVEKYEIYLSKIESGVIPPLDVDHWAFDNKQAIQWLHGESIVPDRKTELDEMKAQAAKDNVNPFKDYVPEYLLLSQRMSWPKIRQFCDAWMNHKKAKGVISTWKEDKEDCEYPAPASHREEEEEETKVDPAVPDLKPIVYRDLQ